MKAKLALLAGVCAGAIAFPAHAQDAIEEDEPEFRTGTEIIVTAQRQAQRLQDVPLAVSALSSEALEAQQIENTSDLQLTLPNVTFTKTNFTTSSFTIRGIGDLCTGVTCDAATGIHINEAPLFNTRLFEGEFYDLEQIEVLRGPQGTLFGRNATSGVVNIRTARPDLSEFSGSIEGEYGNFDSVKVKAMLNAPLGDIAGVRVAGFYLNRDGYTENLFNDTRIDGRDLYGIRGSLRFEPSVSTTIDLMAQYFREDDDRLRIQKQLCQRDPTAVLGCLNGSLDNDVTNANSTLASLLPSRELFAIQGLPTAFALGSVYDPVDAYASAINPTDPRQVATDYTPTYFADELILQAQLNQQLGDRFNLRLSGTYQESTVDSTQDYNLAVQSRASVQNALNTLAFGAAGGLDGMSPGLSTYLAPVAAALIPNGPGGQICTSRPEESGTGVFGGNAVCADTPLALDRSNQDTSAFSAEAVVSSDLDGAFNFLLGAIYAESEFSENSYYVNSFGLDYFTGVVGAFSAYGAGAPPSYLGTPFYRNNTTDFKLESYGIFGEAYVDVSDKLSLTAGLRYNNDSKSVSARTTLANFLVPFGTDDAFNSPFIPGSTFDADPNTAGQQLLQMREADFDEFTGRAVLEYKLTPDNLLYASYSRGYKSGGINPPLSPIFAVPETFEPEFVDAFEIGSKNTFSFGTLNLTGFYYKYDSLQLSRIVARTSVNDNVSADIYGLEAETVLRPTAALTINASASLLETEVSDDKFLSNPRDFSGGRSDAVIIKDLTNGSNCAVAPGTAGNAAGANTFVGFVNQQINAGAIPGVGAGAGLQPPAPFPAGSGIAATGAFSICSALDAVAGLAGTNFDPQGIQVFSSGIPVNIKGNELPGAPEYKLAAGIQYDIYFNDDLKLTPRFDIAHTGPSSGNIFNGTINEIDGFTQANAQIQLTGDNFFARAFVQNIFDDDSVTGFYVTDQSSGNFTNIFTLEPRRYGVAVGFQF